MTCAIAPSCVYCLHTTGDDCGAELPAAGIRAGGRDTSAALWRAGAGCDEVFLQGVFLRACPIKRRTHTRKPCVRRNGTCWLCMSPGLQRPHLRSSLHDFDMTSAIHMSALLLLEAYFGYGSIPAALIVACRLAKTMRHRYTCS